MSKTFCTTRDIPKFFQLELAYTLDRASSREFCNITLSLKSLFAHSFIRYTINTYTSSRTCKYLLLITNDCFGTVDMIHKRAILRVTGTLYWRQRVYPKQSRIRTPDGD